MKIKIEIECETVMNIRQHLHVISQQIKKEAKKQGVDIVSDMYTSSQKFEDNNCYGTHTVKIKP